MAEEDQHSVLSPQLDAGGPGLFHAINLTLLVATVGSGIGSQIAAARMMYGMGRDNAIPRGFFGVMADGVLLDRTDAQLAHEFDVMQASGVESVRIVVYWADLQPTGPQSTDFYLRQGHDVTRRRAMEGVADVRLLIVSRKRGCP